jgi:integrase
MRSFCTSRSTRRRSTSSPRTPSGTTPLGLRSPLHAPRYLTHGWLPRQRFHDLRDACATLRLEQGEELAVVSRIFGHASITTTANLHGHLTDAMLGRAAERTETILRRRVASTA